jgi:uncharacterized protein YjbI with pentapeptide repeats
MGSGTSPLDSRRSYTKWRAWKIVGIILFLVIIAGLPDLLTFHRAKIETVEARTLEIWQNYEESIRQGDIFAELNVVAGSVLVGLTLLASVLWTYRFGARLYRRIAAGLEDQLSPWADKLKPEDMLKLQNEIRASRIQLISTIAQIAGGSVLLIGVYFTAANLGVAREGQITERFTRAIDQIGSSYEVTQDNRPSANTQAADSVQQRPGRSQPSENLAYKSPAAIFVTGDVFKARKPNIEVRLGGIYALGRIAKESPEDYWPIMRILTEYVRNNAEAQAVKPRSDIQAVLRVIGDRDASHEKGQRVDLSDTYLNGAQLPGNFGHVELNSAHLVAAELTGAHLTVADLRRAHLTSAQLADADLRQADLRGADLTGAFLLGTDLTGADLSSADLTGAHLQFANLHGTTLIGAHLNRSDLSWAHLSGADLSSADLTGAHLGRADLLGAILFNANLTKAVLEGANLTGAVLKGTNLTGAVLDRADLRGAVHLNQDQVHSALIDSYTKLSPPLVNPMLSPPHP